MASNAKCESPESDTNYWTEIVKNSWTSESVHENTANSSCMRDKKHSTKSYYDGTAARGKIRGTSVWANEGDISRIATLK